LGVNLDRLLVILFIILQAAILLTSAAPLHQNLMLVLLVGLFVPQIVWNWLMGFLVFLHHTHPSVTWYADREEWSFFSGQVRGTVHILFPWPFGYMLHNIMEHTAHHVDPRIPLYNLAPCQKLLETEYESDIVVQRWSLDYFLRTLRTCQLYDFDHHQWLNFSGDPTAVPTL